MLWTDDTEEDGSLRRVVAASAQPAASPGRGSALQPLAQRVRRLVPGERLDLRVVAHESEDLGVGRPPALLVPPLMMSTELWDVAPGSSPVTTLFRAGIDPWVVDFGSPEEEEGGLEGGAEEGSEEASEEVSGGVAGGDRISRPTLVGAAPSRLRRRLRPGISPRGS